MPLPPTDGLRFRWPWRDYQERVLRTVDRHLQDRRLHIVAAPGAGKTTLGLEVFRRLARPALILAPTLTIRDQWLLRLEDFLPPGSVADPAAQLAAWTSRDLDAPAYLTVVTYQALLVRSRADEAPDGAGADEERPEPPGDEVDLDATPAGDAPSRDDVAGFVERLRAAGVGTLILDEAHHLRRAWWRALDRVVAELDGLTLVSLTATPPYDATGGEWRRYEKLCGPIDDEISVPELVRAGTLCPHQDFVYAVEPTGAERVAVSEHDAVVAETVEALLHDPEMARAVDAHPWVASAAPDVADVLDRPEVAVALLAFLRATGGALPVGLLAALALGADELPRLDRRGWEVLLREYLFGDTFPAGAHRRALAGTLRERGLLWRRSLRIARSPVTERSLALSSAKVAACVEIHRSERAARGEALRQVVLTDFIRDEALDAPPGSAEPDLGAFPVFEALARSGPEDARGDVCLVSGRLTVVHASRRDTLAEALAPAHEARFVELPHRPGWLRVTEVRSGALVAAVTALLADGEVRAIVGTRGLLGEGWDAPAVNSLVLASYVGAFVSTNQMRGRAIRRDPRTRGKVSSIWHLAAVAPETPGGLLDLEQLAARFATFVGLAHSGDVIESGLERLALPSLEGEAAVAALNAESVRRLGALDDVAEGWSRAIERGSTGQVVPTVRFRSPPTLRPLHVRATLRTVLHEAGWASVFTGGEILRRVATGGWRSVGTALLVAAGVPMLILAPKLWRAARLALRHLPVDGSVRQIAGAVLEALEAVDLVEGEGLRVRSERLPDGSAVVSLEGGTFYDQSLFADAVGEILGPVENPRYLITRRRRGSTAGPVDYHAVPSVLGAKRELAEALHTAWLRRVGPGALVYTRREGGREALLAARGRAFSNQFVDPAERLDRWQ